MKPHSIQLRKHVLPVALLFGLTLLGMTVLPGCQTLREVANLRFVDFSIAGVQQTRLAGVDVSRVRSYADLSAIDALRIGSAVAEGKLPLKFQLQLAARNPESNGVQARLVQMDWTLFLEDRETISGVFNQEVVLPPGQSVGIPIDIELDLLRFFNNNARDLVELVLALSGQGGASKDVRLEATPTIRTPIGPIRYPNPITIVNRELGS